jgi:hypothetical protein
MLEPVMMTSSTAGALPAAGACAAAPVAAVSNMPTSAWRTIKGKVFSCAECGAEVDASFKGSARETTEFIG